MRVNQLALKREGAVTKILALGEANSVHYLTEGTRGGEFKTWDLQSWDPQLSPRGSYRTDGRQAESPPTWTERERVPST